MFEINITKENLIILFFIDSENFICSEVPNWAWCANKVLNTELIHIYKFIFLRSKKVKRLTKNKWISSNNMISSNNIVKSSLKTKAFPVLQGSKIEKINNSLEFNFFENFSI